MNAFLPEATVEIAATNTGPLSGLRFAVKDLIDIAGLTTGGGNPDWLRSHAPATRHAPCVSMLLHAGASIYGKTISDELAYSLEGANHFYGTPINPRWPWALPGGSSSGSASAVASRIVDFALGTDTGGSVRVPAAFCGIWGIRPTHDAVPLEGVLPFAPAFDTVGWFANSGEILAKVAEVLLPKGDSPPTQKPLYLFAEAVAMHAQHSARDGAIFSEIARNAGANASVSLFKDRAEDWLSCYQFLQDYNIYNTLGAWISQSNPTFGPSIAPRFARIQTTQLDQLAYYQQLRNELIKGVQQQLEHSFLIFPTVPVALLPKNASADALHDFYHDSLLINAVAGLGGFPQISVPVLNEIERPIALSMLGAVGSDKALIAAAQEIYTISQNIPKPLND